MAPNITSIGVFSPSSYVEREDIEQSKSRLETMGYKVFIHPQTYARHHQFAGTNAEKISALYDLWENPDIDIIWAAGGGNGSSWLIDMMNYGRLKQAPKTLIGFSDVTALSCALYGHAGIPSIHGQVLKNLHKFNEDDLKATLDLASGHAAPPMDLSGIHVISEGDASGHLIGGNLSVFQYLPATLPGNICDGAILFLEDTGEELSHLDRTLLFLKRSGILEQAAGIVFGEFSNMKDAGRPYGKSLHDIIQEHTKKLNIPVVMNAPFGHGSRLFPLMAGSNYHLRIQESGAKLRPA